MTTCAMTPLESMLVVTSDVFDNSPCVSWPMSLLWEFADREIKDFVTPDYEDLNNAVFESNCALNKAAHELDELIESLSKLPTHLPIKQALGQADNAYYSGEGRLTEDLVEGERGDGLADFIAQTIHEHTSEPGIVSMRAVNEYLKVGQSHLETCIEQIEQLTSAPSSRPRPSQ